MHIYQQLTKEIKALQHQLDSEDLSDKEVAKIKRKIKKLTVKKGSHFLDWISDDTGKSAGVIKIPGGTRNF